MKRYLTIAEAADYLGVSIRRIIDLEITRKITNCADPGEPVVYDVAELDKVRADGEADIGNG